MVYEISNQIEWDAWDGVSDIEFTANFDLSDPTLHTLDTSVNVDGKGFTITFKSSVCNGLFGIGSTASGTYLIENIIMVFAHTTTVNAIAAMIITSQSSNIYDLTLNKIKISGDFYFVTPRHGVFGEFIYGTISNSIVEPNRIVDHGGVFAGQLSPSTVIIQNCFSSGILIRQSGGIVGSSSSAQIYNCYSSCDMTGLGSGGIAGEQFTGRLENCYSIGDISDAAGGIVGSVASGGIVKNCYFSGTHILEAASGGITAAVYAGGTLENCFSLESNKLVGKYGVARTNSGTITDCGFGSNTWNETVLLNTFTSGISGVGTYTNIWSDASFNSPPVDTGNPYLLTSFTDGVIWNHTTYDSVENFLVVIESDPSCFMEGTMIYTPSGEIEIENLNINDKIITSDGRTVEILDISKTYEKSFIIYTIPKDCFGENIPNRSLRITGTHLFKLKNKPWQCAMSIKNNPKIKWNVERGYLYNILLQSYEEDTLLANGLTCDSLHDIKENILYLNREHKLCYDPNRISEKQYKFIMCD